MFSKEKALLWLGPLVFDLSGTATTNNVPTGFLLRSFDLDKFDSFRFAAVLRVIPIEIKFRWLI
jgi:hypothetical protein